MKALVIPTPQAITGLIFSIRAQVDSLTQDQISTSTPSQLGLDEFDSVELLVGIAALFEVRVLPELADEELQISEIVSAFVAQAVTESIA